MEHANFLTYVNARRAGKRAVEAISQARTEAAVCGWTSFIPHGNITRQLDRPNYAWIENTDAAGLRVVGYVHELVRLRHTGWYGDEFGDSLYRGIVFRLPHSRGLIAGYADPWNDGAAFVELSLYDADDTNGAAFAADNIAENEAEREREYQERETERERQEEETEELFDHD